MYPGHVFVSQCKADSIKLGSRFNFWILQPFPPNPEELVHFRAVSYSVALNLSASRLGKKYKLCETAILQPFASLIFKTKIYGLFFWVAGVSLAAVVNGAAHPLVLCRAQTCCRAGCRGQRVSAGREAGPCASVQVCASKGRRGKGGTVRCDEFVALASVLSSVCMENQAWVLLCCPVWGKQHLEVFEWDEWDFLLASLPAAVGVIFYPSCCCLLTGLLLSAAVVPGTLCLSGWEKPFQVTAGEWLFVIATGRPFIDSSAG